MEHFRVLREAWDAIVFDPIAICFACALAITGGLISFFTIGMHLKHNTKPRLQRYVIRLLLFVPVYAVFSVLILFFSDKYVYFVTLRDVWEAVVVYSFFSLILEFCGGENACALQICDNPGTIHHPWPSSILIRLLRNRTEVTGEFTRILNDSVPCDVYFIKFCKRCIITFAIAKPLVSLATIVLHATKLDEFLPYIIIIEIIYNLSVLVALYALVLFYMSVRGLDALANQRPILKFLSIKIIIAAAWYQSLLLSLFFGFGSSLVAIWNNWILCMELPFIALLQYYAFPTEDARTSVKNELQSAPFLDALSLDHSRYRVQNEEACSGKNAAAGSILAQNSKATVVSTTGVAAIPKRKGDDTVLRSMKDTVSIKDVVNDAYYNFSKKYNNHTLLIDSEVDETDSENFTSAEPNALNTFRLPVVGHQDFTQGVI